MCPMWRNNNWVSKVTGNFPCNSLDRFDSLLNIAGEHAAGGTGKTDGCHCLPLLVQDRRTNTRQTIFQLLVVHGVARSRTFASSDRSAATVVMV